MGFSRFKEHSEDFAAAPDPERGAPVGPYLAEVAEDATAMNQRLHIRFIDHAPDQQHGAPARWMPRNDTQPMPKRGDSCLVSIDETQTPWILVWWPYADS